ncbi:MAG TPA: DUF1549 and DUF1553 domain-containing protein [Pirellulales bacterium]|nr:DUF1549 and DUF1553 domain-containing protein [Pirellulales bacterium]
MSRISGIPGRRRQRQANCVVWIACGVWLAATPALFAQGAGELDDDELDIAAVSQRIDQLLEVRLREAGATPAPLAGDAEFLRRVYLDLSGVIPPAADVLAFQADERPDKRARAIDRLLANPRFGTHLAQVWTKMLLPADALTDRADQVAGFTAWLRRRFAENIRYDNVVADLLTTTGNSDRGGAALFYTASGLKPEELASSTSRIFLGVQIQCAQCHNHPFDRWQQEDFWGYAAFFARLQQAPGTQAPAVELVDALAGEVTLPDSEQVITPKYLGDEPPQEDADANRRRQLAIWIVSRDNPYFARVAVNRVWAHLFGRGLVHPPDDFSEHNPPSHPEVLNVLEDFFLDSGYDLKAVFRALAGTRAYQRSSRALSEGDVLPPELFGRMQVKVLSPEQLYDCLMQATRRFEPAAPAPVPGAPPQANANGRQQFIARFNRSATEVTEFEAGIPQVLSLMNGPLTAEITDPDRSGILLALEAPVFDDADRIEALFLSVLSRPASADERRELLAYVESGGPSHDRRKALGDVLWTMLNSSEFILNY